jgi:hypothetical protein
VIDAATKVWVCEEGHIDDHHIEDGGICLGCGGGGVGDHGAGDDPACSACQGSGRAINALCSRCGGTCRCWSLDRLASEYVERLRVNVGLVAENTKLKRRLEDEGR